MQRERATGALPCAVSLSTPPVSVGHPCPPVRATRTSHLFVPLLASPLDGAFDSAAVTRLRRAHSVCRMAAAAHACLRLVSHFSRLLPSFRVGSPWMAGLKLARGWRGLVTRPAPRPGEDGAECLLRMDGQRRPACVFIHVPTRPELCARAPRGVGVPLRPAPFFWLFFFGLYWVILEAGTRAVFLRICVF